MNSVPSSPELDNALVDPVTWSDEDLIHRYLAWLRAHDPVRRIAPDGYEPFYAITRHADVMAVERDKEGFINDPRPTLAPTMITDAITQLTGRRHLVRSLVQMDDPDHMKYRLLTASFFTRQKLEAMKTTVEALAKHYVDRMAEFGGECDFVRDVAIWYPLRVVMSVLGVPPEDEPLMMKLTQELFGSTDPDVQRSFDLMAIGDVVKDFEAYFAELSADRRAHPRDDMATIIANAQIDGQPIPDLEAAGYYIIVATAGHDTTSSSTAGGLLALMEHPGELEKLRADPGKHVAGAVEEMIRWVSPVRHFMRTATRPQVLRGQEIEAGESVILWYPSANRDEEVFEAPFEFRIERPAARNLAFGYGAHVCLGQHLARMEMQAFYRELLARVDHFELAGTPRYAQAAFVGGLKSLPIRYRMK
ncbi:MAG: cytochrome P450 [Pseudomonadales bacterium]|jgi:cytochrome P450|nr:cytochrome P450 [Pseudomonadales bacterium]